MILPATQPEIVDWHDTQWVQHDGSPKTEQQIALKLAEEAGEVCAAITKRYEKRPAFVDGGEAIKEIGDALIVLTVLADRLGTTLEECINLRWDTVKHRRSAEVVAG